MTPVISQLVSNWLFSGFTLFHFLFIPACRFKVIWLVVIVCCIMYSSSYIVTVCPSNVCPVVFPSYPPPSPCLLLCWLFDCFEAEFGPVSAFGGQFRTFVEECSVAYHGHYVHFLRQAELTSSTSFVVGWGLVNDFPFKIWIGPEVVLPDMVWEGGMTEKQQDRH